MSNESKLILLDIEPRSAIEVLQDPPTLSTIFTTLPSPSLDNVLAFHEAFSCPVGDLPEIPSGPHNQALQVAFDKLMLVREFLRQHAKADGRCQRIALAVEELAELTKALKEQNLVSALDALADIDYINNGTAVAYGFHKVLPEAFHRVHESNMSKLEDGKPVYDETGKVKKGRDYKPVDLTDLVKYIP
jgi:predicted HAD superfamily Cof-like phosphohydrolase